MSNSNTTPPTSQMLAVLGLMITTMGTVLGVVYAAVVKGSEAAQTLLGTLATASLSALVVLAGGRHRDSDESPPGCHGCPACAAGHSI